MTIRSNSVSPVARPRAIEMRVTPSSALKYSFHWHRIFALTINLALWGGIAWLIWKFA